MGYVDMSAVAVEAGRGLQGLGSCSHLMQVLETEFKMSAAAVHAVTIAVLSAPELPSSRTQGSVVQCASTVILPSPPAVTELPKLNPYTQTSNTHTLMHACMPHTRTYARLFLF